MSKLPAVQWTLRCEFRYTWVVLVYSVSLLYLLMWNEAQRQPQELHPLSIWTKSKLHSKSIKFLVKHVFTIDKTCNNNILLKLSRISIKSIFCNNLIFDNVLSFTILHLIVWKDRLKFLAVAIVNTQVKYVYSSKNKTFYQNVRIGSRTSNLLSRYHDAQPHATVFLSDGSNKGNKEPSSFLNSIRKKHKLIW